MNGSGRPRSTLIELSQLVSSEDPALLVHASRSDPQERRVDGSKGDASAIYFCPIEPASACSRSPDPVIPHKRRVDLADLSRQDLAGQSLWDLLARPGSRRAPSACVGHAL